MPRAAPAGLSHKTKNNVDFFYPPIPVGEGVEKKSKSATVKKIHNKNQMPFSSPKKISLKTLLPPKEKLEIFESTTVDFFDGNGVYVDSVILHDEDTHTVVKKKFIENIPMRRLQISWSLLH